MKRHLVWFSAGAASAVAAKVTLRGEIAADDVVIAYVDPGSEHPDNERFLTDCEEWFGKEIVRLKSDKYIDTWHVWEQTGYLNGPTGARCTLELKKRVRQQFEHPDDIQVFGYTVEEQHRADRFREQNPDVTLSTPLIDAGLTKSDCLAIIDRAGIQLPAMYRYGFQNNNCIGCPKGGLGYWNHIRRFFPEVFERMAKLERRLGHTCTRDANGPVWLDELDPKRGNHEDEPSFECSLLCAIAEDSFSKGVAS